MIAAPVFPVQLGSQSDNGCTETREIKDEYDTSVAKTFLRFSFCKEGFLTCLVFFQGPPHPAPHLPDARFALCETERRVKSKARFHPDSFPVIHRKHCPVPEKGVGVVNLESAS